MKSTVKVEGLRELERNMERLSRSASKGVARRTLKKAAQPTAALMRQKAPRGNTATDELADSIAVSTKLSSRQKKMHRKIRSRTAVEMFVGPGPDPAAVNQEFGNINHGPQAFVRPAWDEDRKALLQRISALLRVEIDKSIKRAERKAARAG